MSAVWPVPSPTLTDEPDPPAYALTRQLHALELMARESGISREDFAIALLTAATHAVRASEPDRYAFAITLTRQAHFLSRAGAERAAQELKW
jgi:hypothetical protein